MLIATTHKNTDFDALASVIAATILFPDCIGVVPKMVNRNVNQFLSTHKTAFNLILPNEVQHDKVTKLVVVDTDQWHRLDRMEKLQQRTNIEIELWDHHMSGKGSIKASTVIKEHVGATITLLVRELRRQNKELSPLESTVMLIGLYEDTGHLTFPTTTPEDALAAAFLLEKKADLNVSSFFLNPPYEENQKEILFEMMKETEKVSINGNVIGFNTVILDRKVPNLAAVVNIYRKIVNVDALFVICVADDRNTVIGRSGIESVHIGQILTELGGGGHPGAGSATLKHKEMTKEEIRQTITDGLSRDTKEIAGIADIMSFPVISVPPDTPMTEVQSIMATEKIRGIIVMEGTAICGVIVLWDFKRVKRAKQWKMPVKAFMARDIITIGPEVSPTVAARLMIEKDVGYLPVIQDEKVIGIVTRTDILTYYYDLLPE